MIQAIKIEFLSNKVTVGIFNEARAKSLQRLYEHTFPRVAYLGRRPRIGLPTLPETPDQSSFPYYAKFKLSFRKPSFKPSSLHASQQPPGTPNTVSPSTPATPFPSLPPVPTQPSLATSLSPVSQITQNGRDSMPRSRLFVVSNQGDEFDGEVESATSPTQGSLTSQLQQEQIIDMRSLDKV